jgi:hypothetical protein
MREASAEKVHTQNLVKRAREHISLQVIEIVQKINSTNLSLFTYAV